MTAATDYYSDKCVLSKRMPLANPVFRPRWDIEHRSASRFLNISVSSVPFLCSRLSAGLLGFIPCWLAATVYVPFCAVFV
jgi:hypothetical protein